MKDASSFDVAGGGTDRAFNEQREAYKRIFIDVGQVLDRRGFFWIDGDPSRMSSWRELRQRDFMHTARRGYAQI